MSQPLIIGGGGVSGGKQQTTTTTTNSSTTSPQQSSNRLRHFLKFNGPSNNNNNNGDLQQKSNGHIDSKSNPQQCNTKPSSPLIGRNYPHQRVTKSPSIESTTTTTTKSSSPLLNRCQVINLNPVNVNNHSKQNSFDHHNTGLSSPNLNNNLQSKQHRHSFRCSTSTTNNNNNNSSSSNQLRQSQHTYDNVASLSRLDQQQQQQQQQSSSMESSPRFVRKNFVRNSTKPTTLTAAVSIDQPSTYGQITMQTNSSRWSQQQQQNMVANNDNDDDDDDDDDKHGKQFEWIEIFEPKSRTKMFANLSTGECSWFEPKNVQILRQSNPKITQWWELYDQKSQRFYYYSVKDSKTIWQKPNTVDAIIVPLAKLQIIKQAANNNNSTPLDRIISNSSRTSQPLNNSSSPLSSASSSPSSATNTGRSPQLISPNSATSICIRCRQRPIMVDSFTQTFNNNNNNSSDSIRSSSSKQSMVSRWTQTTSQTPVDIRRLPDLLSDDLRRQQQQQQQHAHQQPSLRHYLLSEARFAARGQTAGGLLNTHPQNNDNDNNRIYDPIAPESIYDPVAQIDDYYDDDYFDVDDDELTDYGDDEDDEISFDSCDADDEFGGEDNSYTDDDEEEEDEDLEDDDDESIINVRNDQKGSSSDSHIVGDDDYDDDYNNEMIFNRKRQQQQSIDDYDIVDYGHHDDHQYISSTKSGTNAGNNNRMPAAAAAASGGISRSTLIQQNLDGPLKMSASFTATDFKRNALGRSSYTTTTTTNQQQQPSAIRYEQPSSSNQREQQRESCPKPAYSNPFNNNSNNGSLRSSTGRINMNLDQSLSNEINNNNNNNKGLGSIADRIQLFNQKSTNLPSKTTTPTPTSPKSIHRQQSISVSAYEPTATAAAGLSRGFLHRSATTEGGGAGGAIAAKQVQKFLQQQQPNNVRTSISPVLDQSSIPCKSTSMTLISPSSSSSSSVVNTTTIQQQQQQSNDPVGSSSNGKRSSLSNKFPVTSNNNNQFDLSFEIPRNNSSISLSPSHQQSYRPFVSSSTPVVPLSSYPIPPPHLHHSAFNQMNDVHKSILVNQANVAASFKNSKNKNSNNQTTTVTKGTANKKNNVILDSNQTVTDSKSLKKSTTTTKTIVKNKDKSNGNGNNSIESFARECVSRHRKGGIFSKKKTLKSMLMHTKKPLKKPMISTISDALLVKESVACFKIIQIFMGDRSPSPTCQQQQQQQQHSTGNSNLSTSTTIGERLSPTTTTTLPYNDDQLLVRLINICVQLVPLRDEVLVQVARQVTQNPNPNSERRGLELMCTLFWYFTASNKLAQHLHAFLFGHRNPFTVIVRRKFEQQMYRSRYTHSHLFYRKPHSIDEVSCVLRAVHSKHVGIFGETLSDALVDSTKLPWPVVLLTEALLEPRHEDREGVFRCVGDMDDVHRLKMKLDTLLPEDRNFNQMIGRSTNNNNDSIIQKTSGKLTDDHDIHVIASTLKLYFRELRDSIIPSQMYLQALECAHDPERACALLDQLEPLNRSTLRYLIHFLQIFSTDEFVRDTKMDDANLSMVWAPNILRSPSTNCQQQQQQLLSGPAAAKAAMINSANIYEHTRAEMSFVRTLIQHLPTNNNGNDTSPKKH